MSTALPPWQRGPAWLFCPADRPDRYPKALAAADTVILDLEDAVAPGDRAGARAALSSLAERGVLDVDRTVVRVNAVGSVDHEADLVATRGAGVRCIMLAKAEDSTAVAAIEHRVIALAETARGVEHAGEIARQDNVVAMMWGADDLIAGMGGTTSRLTTGGYRDVARHARARVLIAAKAHGRVALDGVHMDIPDTDGLALACADAVAVGFDATVAIHPSQVPVIRAAYLPSAEKVGWARRLLSQAGADRGVTTFEGRMVDGPIYSQAERLLRLASTGARTTGVASGED